MKDDSVRNQKIIDRRIEGATLSEIGKQYGLTRERIRQIVGPCDPEYKKRRNIERVLNQKYKRNLQNAKRFADKYKKWTAEAQSLFLKEIGATITNM